MSASVVIWHDVECGAYAADLPLWEELAERCGGPVLELGCGTGRVALHLARRGYRVIGLDSDSELILELAERAKGLPVEPLRADALDFELDEPVALVLAPMQFLELFRSDEARLRCLRRIAATLQPGGLLAAAILADLPQPSGVLPLPDMREVDGWVYSSQPSGMGLLGRRLILHRRRQAVSPDGEVSEETDRIELQLIEVDQLKAEAEEAGLTPLSRTTLPPTEDHVGSHVLLFERPA
jgi:SAM-dependent methyltransferase